MMTHSCRAGGWPCGEFRERARWAGANTGHCSSCGQLFRGQRVFDMHQAHDEQGRLWCRDPASLLHRDGTKMLEAVDVPGWEPSYVWRENRPDLGRWTGPGDG